ncbi:MAG: ABC transporter permease [Sedimentisphaerales bacterium]|nr:ABC transporter permease [Sedimentisphaerales bacterium]
MIWFQFKRMVKTGAKSLWMHRLRSVLTMLGIIFGVSSVIAMLAIGAGASREAQEQIVRLGSQNIIIKTVAPPSENVTQQSSQTMREYGLRYSDAQRFRDTLPNVEVIVPERSLNQEARFRHRQAAVKVVGTVPWFPEISPVKLLAGRFFVQTDMDYKPGLCVIDDAIARQLFAYDDPLGQYIKIKSDYYCVIGVVTSSSLNQTSAVSVAASGAGVKGGGGVTGNVYIPISNIKDRFGETNMSSSGGGMQVDRVELSQITIKVRDSDEVLTTRNILDAMLSSSPLHKKKDYQIVVPLELLEQAKETKRIFSIVLGSIAAISLLVGGIGIMNIMLATVSERTREIGIRRALGARRSDIIMQFLSETILLTVAGGVLGIVVGVVIPVLVERFGKMPTEITVSSLVLAFGISAAVGVAFGLYPAYRAAYLDPIESLRHE